MQLPLSAFWLTRGMKGRILAELWCFTLNFWRGAKFPDEWETEGI